MFTIEGWSEFIEQHRGWVEDNPKAWFSYVQLMYRHKEKRWFLDLLNYMGEGLTMRGKKVARATSTAKPKQWTEFVELPIGVEHEEAIRDYCTESDALFDAVQAICETGHRVSLAYNPQTDAIICSVTCKDEDSANMGLTYTSFAGDWVTALRVAMYKHFVLTEGVWRDGGSKSGRPAFG